MPAPRRRDRHGRGARGRLLPPLAGAVGGEVRVPAWRSRSDRFDDLVRRSVAELEGRWPEELGVVEFAVEDVPGKPHEDDAGVVADETSGGAVPLGHVLAARADRPARVVVYRRPLEARADDPVELTELVEDVLLDLVAQLLGIDPDDLDPPGQ